MAFEVVTNDASALSDDDIAEMAAMGGSFGVDEVSAAAENWVLATTARSGAALHGFCFSTLERIGGTPCVLLGLLSVKRTSRRDTALRGLMKEAFHRALMAFPDEDVVVGARFCNADGMVILRDLDDVTPTPGTRAVGEERAWGRRLAKRFGVDAHYDAESFTVASGSGDGFIDVEALKPGDVDSDRHALFSGADTAAGGVVIAYGWSMAEDLARLGAR